MYADAVEILRAQPGTTIGRVFNPADGRRLYSGPADVQYEPIAIKRRRREGDPRPEYDAIIYFPLEGTSDLFGAGADRMKPNDLVVVTPARGPVRRGRVGAVDPLNDSATVSWLVAR